jgi:hypothetical protein
MASQHRSSGGSAPSSTRRRLASVIVLAIIALIVSLAGSVQTAQAVCMPWNVRCHPHVATYNGSWVALRYTPSTGLRPHSWVPSPTRVHISCWTWGHYAVGNYRSSKWFRIQNWHNGAWTYVHSSYVFNQHWVRRC